MTRMNSSFGGFTINLANLTSEIVAELVVQKFTAKSHFDRGFWCQKTTVLKIPVTLVIDGWMIVMTDEILSRSSYFTLAL